MCGLNVFNLYLELLISNKGDTLKDHFLLSRHEGRNVPWVLFAISDFHKTSFITNLCSLKCMYFSELSFLHSADHGRTLILELFEVHVSGGGFFSLYYNISSQNLQNLWMFSTLLNTDQSDSLSLSVFCPMPVLSTW